MMLGEIQEIKTSNAYDIQDSQIIVPGLNIVTPSQKINLVVFFSKIYNTNTGSPPFVIRKRQMLKLSFVQSIS